MQMRLQLDHWKMSSCLLSGRTCEEIFEKRKVLQASEHFAVHCLVQSLCVWRVFVNLRLQQSNILLLH
jgi:hypothetical protein